MTKIKYEEYKALKDLDDKWEWIARDSRGDNGGSLAVYLEKPFKRYDTREWDFGCSIGIRYIDNHLFQFIQWENEEPYNIQKLVEEYEFGKILLAMAEEETVLEFEYESEETEVKNIEWLKEKVDDLQIYSNPETHADRSDPYTRYVEGVNDTVSRVKELLNQLDEPETLSEYWIEQKSVGVHVDTLSGELQVMFRMDDLQNIIVPKQELPVIPKFVADWFEENKEHFESKLKSIIKYPPQYDEDVTDFTQWVSNSNNKPLQTLSNMFNGYEVAEEQKYYVVKSEGLDGVHYYFTKFDDEMNGLFTLPNDKKGAYRFEDKEKAQAIANYTDSEVEEME